jgi:hypothetical protein
MTHDFLPKFRRQLFDWLQCRLTDGRLPFRRVEEQPLVMTGARLAIPDLVLWINRDSLLAGAMILTPAHVDPSVLQEGCTVAGSLGLRQFVTWEARAVNVWETGLPVPTLLKSWPMPAVGAISAANFTGVFEQLLQELKGLAVEAVLPAEQLPAAYFANLCRQVLRDIEPALQAAARMAAAAGQTDTRIAQAANAKGWLTLWRLLALLRHDRMPAGIRPERFERAIGYALADLDRELVRQLAPVHHEPPLPESAAVRFHHLAGRLAQLGWPREPQRALTSLQLLCAEAGREGRVETRPLDPPPDRHDLLVNHLPPQPLAEPTLVAAWPVLAGLALTAAGRSTRILQKIAALPADCKPRRIIAALDDSQPPSPTERRERLAALRQPWPYRRFRLAAATPAWLWDALHLAGLADPEGILQLTLPANWTLAQDAELLWQSLTERLALAELQLHDDGRQTLTMAGHDQATDTLEIHYPDGTPRQFPALLDDAPLAAVAALALPVAAGPPPARRRPRPALADKIAAKVFVDGLPHFPEHYLRRIDLPPLRSYQLPGPLQPDSCFFDRVRLTGPGGGLVEVDHPVDAEALLLASRDGRSQVALPADPEVTARLLAAYRNDLQHLWQALLDECRRHHPAQRHALSLARRLWRERRLPEVEND